jgi:hypothetical protein
VRKEWFESHWSTGHQESVVVHLPCMTDFFGQEYLKLETISLTKSEKFLLLLPDFNCSFYKGVNKQLPRVMKHYSPSGRRNHGRPLKRLLDT